MTTPVTLSDSNLQKRLEAFEQLVEEGKRYQPGAAPNEYTQRLEAATQEIDSRMTVDELVATATKGSGWFAGYKDRNGNKVSKGQIDAAKELLPADKMVDATMRGLVEKYGGDRPNRLLGKRYETWQKEIKQLSAQADSALADLKAGKPNGAADLGAALSGIGRTMTSMQAESVRDAQAKDKLARDVEGFSHVADDTGLFNRRKTEKAALSAAREVNSGLEGEIDAENAMTGTAPGLVRPYVIGQLESDPAFADRGYVGLTARSSAWAQVITSGETLSDGASSLASAIGTYAAALETAASAPGRVTALEGELRQARAELSVAMRSLSDAQAQHSSVDRHLSNELIAVSQRAGAASAALEDADGNVRGWHHTVDKCIDRVSGLSRKVSRLEDELDQARNPKTLPPGLPDGAPPPGRTLPPGLPGGAPPPGRTLPPGLPSGSTQPPGLPGGSNAGEIARLEAELAAAKRERRNAETELNKDRESLGFAERDLEVKADKARSANEDVGILNAKRQANDAWLGQFQNAANIAQDRANRLASDLDSTGSSLSAARHNVASAPQDIGKCADAFNRALAAFDKTVGRAGIGDDGKGSMQNISLSAVKKAELLAQVANKEDGIRALQAVGSAVAASAGQRLSAATVTRTAINGQIQQVIETEVQRTLAR